MSKADPRKLKDDAVRAVADRKWKRALECYRALEEVEPKNGMWPQKSGEILRKMGHDDAAVAALDRAVETYSQAGFLVKAIAVCKLILEIDPSHTSTQSKLASLHSTRDQSRPAPRTPAPKTLPPANAPNVSVPLAQAPLVALVPDAKKAQWVDSDGVVEIPLDLEVELEIILENRPPPKRPSTARPIASEAVAQDVLPKTPLFSAFDEERLGRLIQEVRLVNLPAGQVLFRQGDVADALYVVAEGEVAVITRSGGAEREVGRLGEGMFFGEIALITDQPRSATICAAKDSRLIAIDRVAVAKLMIESPEVVKILLRFVRDRLIDSLVTTNRLFAPFSGADRQALVARFRFVQADAGATLIEEGKRTPGLFVVLAGTAMVLVNGRPIAELIPGDVCGEISLLTGGPAVATIRTASRCCVLELPRGDFQDVIMTHPQVLEFASDLAEERRRLLDAFKTGKATYHEGRLRMV